MRSLLRAGRRMLRLGPAGETVRPPETPLDRSNLATTDSAVLPTPTPPRLALRNVSKEFVGQAGTVLLALADLNLEIDAHEWVCVMGPSGSGKTTLIHLAAGFIAPTRGRVEVNGLPITGPGADRAVVFQEDAVFPWLTVADNIAFGSSVRQQDPVRRQQVTQDLISLMDLDAFKHAHPRSLSGGMKKKVDIARAFANDPDVLLMDEPFGSLDIITKEYLQIELQKLWMGQPKTTMFVTHDLEEALFLGDRILVLTERPGRVCATYNVAFARPRDPQIKTTIEFQRLRKEIRDFLRQGAEPPTRSWSVVDSAGLDRQQSEFVSLVAHELRTPLSSVLALSELLLDRSYEAATERELIADIHGEARRLERIVSDLQDVARLDTERLSLQRKVIVVPHLLEDVIRSTAALCSRHRVVLACQGQLPTLRADAARLEQILFNLLSNASAYSPAGSTITIGASSRQPSVPVGETEQARSNQADAAGCRARDAPGISIWVADEGIGIPTDELPRVFEKFYRATNSAQYKPNGSGLGLYIARRLAQLHDGDIEAHSSLGVGSTFEVWIPDGPQQSYPS